MGTARGLGVVLLLLAAACGSATPLSPTVTAPVTAQVNAQVPAGPPTNFPPLTGPSRTFIFDRQLSGPGPAPGSSQFVLYENGAFELQIPPMVKGYRGRYTRTDADLVFEWEGWSVAGPWGATGTLDGRVLTVRYNLIMWLSDFADAVYVLKG